MPVLFVLGKDGKLYIGETGAALAAMDVMDNVRDVTVTMEAGEADVTTRGNGGWKATAPTTRECTVEFEMLARPDDEATQAILAAFFTSGTVELAPLTGARDASGSQGPKGAFSITGCTRGEALEEAITYSVTAKLAAIDSNYENGWVNVA